MNALTNKRGQGLTEYTLILAAVVVLAVLLLKQFKEPVKSQIEGIGAELATNK